MRTRRTQRSRLLEIEPADITPAVHTERNNSSLTLTLMQLPNRGGAIGCATSHMPLNAIKCRMCCVAKRHEFSREASLSAEDGCSELIPRELGQPIVLREAGMFPLTMLQLPEHLRRRTFVWALRQHSKRCRGSSKAANPATPGL